MTRAKKPQPARYTYVIKYTAGYTTKLQEVTINGYDVRSIDPDLMVIVDHDDRTLFMIPAPCVVSVTATKAVARSRKKAAPVMGVVAPLKVPANKASVAKG